MGREDLVDGLVPFEGPGVLVPRPDPLAHAPLQRLDAAMVAALEHLAGDLGEQALDLVQAARISRGEMHVEPRMALQPRVHARRLAGPVAVTPLPIQGPRPAGP